MPHVRSHREFQSVAQLPFCYRCAGGFDDVENVPDRDHVPPKSIFAKEDRALRPLILPTHKRCNGLSSTRDEEMAKFLRLLHTPPSRDKDIPRGFEGVVKLTNGTTMFLVDGRRIPHDLARWLRGFHAALYGEPLDELSGHFSMPFPASNNGKRIDEIPAQHFAFGELLQLNRRVGRVDTIVAFNGKCKYMCTWPCFDDGRRFCCFALNLYDWHLMGDVGVQPQRSCVGFYFAPPSGRPARATTATELMTHGWQVDRLNPFED